MNTMTYPYIDIHTHSEESSALTIQTAGIHPWDAEEYDLSEIELKREVEADIATADAAGELGLDFVAEVDREAQRELFVAQLKLAKKHKKPVVLHCVRAFEPTMQILSTFPVKVIFHGFIGSVQQMNQAVAAGYYISFGDRTFASPKTMKALRECPLERLLLETDTVNISIEEIYERVSKSRMESTEELREAIYNNFKTIFPELC